MKYWKSKKNGVLFAYRDDYKDYPDFDKKFEIVDIPSEADEKNEKINSDENSSINLDDSAEDDTVVKIGRKKK